MAYDAGRGEVVLFGGSHGTLSPRDTWVWNGTAWTQKFPVHSPPARYGTSMAYDAIRGQVVLFGGDANGVGLLNDTWVWDGADWIQKTPSTSPTGRRNFAMVYDSARGEVVLFGGAVGLASDETWVWNGVNWTERLPVRRPPGLMNHAMAYDAARGETVLFGGHYNGAYYNHTWLWDGTNWTQRTTNAPTPRNYHTMAYDAGRQQVVLFGGDPFNLTFLDDTWTWDGTTWTKQTPATTPRFRIRSAMAFDQARGQVVMFSGASSFDILNDTWVWPQAYTPPETVSDNFNRPDGPVGNGWSNTSGNLRADLVLKNGALTTPGPDGEAGITRAINLSAPVTVSFKATQANGAGGLLRRYETSVLFGGDGSLRSGYGVLFYRGDQNFNNSAVRLVLNGTDLESIPVPFQFEESITVSLTHQPDGAIFGTVGSNLATFPFSFGPRQLPARASSLTLNLRFPDGRSSVFTNPTVDDFLVVPAALPGSISVSTNLPSASFTITGPVNTSGTGTAFTRSNVPPGTYTIVYGAANCLSTPPSETKSLAPGGTLTFARANYFGAASLTLGVTPLAASIATFSLNPPIPSMPGTGPYPRTQNGVWPQAYTVAFNSVAGFTTPPAQTASPDASCRINFTGNYKLAEPGGVPATVTLRTNNDASGNPLGGFTVSDATGQILARSVSSFVATVGKTYSLRFAAIAGYFSPADRKITPAAAGELVVGRYKRLILVSFTGAVNAPFTLDGLACGADWEKVCRTGFGVEYPNSLLACADRGMTNIVLGANGITPPAPGVFTSALSAGLVSRAFTFYDETTVSGQGLLGPPCAKPATDLHSTAVTWLIGRRPTPDDAIAVVGHSYGGNRARLFAEQIGSTYAVDSLILVDPVDWSTCGGGNFGSNLGVDLRCDQRAIAMAQPVPETVKAFWTFTQSRSSIKGYALRNGTVVVNHKEIDRYHDQIDDDPEVHQFILDALTGVVRGPRSLTPILGSRGRDASAISIAVAIKAVQQGNAIGFGKASGVRITSASLNGIPATGPLPDVGDIVAGQTSNPVTLRFASSAANPGNNVPLAIRFENADGALFAYTIRVVAP